MSTRTFAKARLAAANRAKPVTVRILLKPQTQRILVERNTEVSVLQQQLALATQRLHDVMRSIYTEHGIAEGRPLEVTDKAPFEFVVEVTKRASAKQGG